MRGCALRYSDNLSQNTLNILQHLVIPETQNVNPSLLQHLRSIHIPFRLARMLAAIRLHNQIRALAEEIGVKPKQRNLTPELQTFELAIAKVSPELSFSVSARAA